MFYRIFLLQYLTIAWLRSQFLYVSLEDRRTQRILPMPHVRLNQREHRLCGEVLRIYLKAPGACRAHIFLELADFVIGLIDQNNGIRIGRERGNGVPAYGLDSQVRIPLWKLGNPPFRLAAPSTDGNNKVSCHFCYLCVCLGYITSPPFIAQIYQIIYRPKAECRKWFLDISCG